MPATTSETSSSSTDPANTTTENRGATHAGSPAWTTSIPKAMPSGNRPRPAPSVTATPERTSAHREGGTGAREDSGEELMMVSMVSHALGGPAT